MDNRKDKADKDEVATDKSNDELTATTELSATVDGNDDDMSKRDDDKSLIEQSEEHLKEERLLCAARLLRQVQDKDLLNEEHLEVLKYATIFEKSISELQSDPTDKDQGWIKQVEMHGNSGDRDLAIFFKMEDKTKLHCRIESPIESSLLVPLLAVFNESDLYSTFMPQWKHPRLGVTESNKLKQKGRTSQIVQIMTAMPWPLADREVILNARAIDDIDENGIIAMKIDHCNPGDENGLIPEPASKIVRVDFNSAFLIRQCPKDHFALHNSKRQYPEDEHLLLFSVLLYSDAHVGAVPISLINFVTRTVMARQWLSLLHVAEDIRAGKRPGHEKFIKEKTELYDWVNNRIDVMFEKLGGSYNDEANNDSNNKSDKQLS